MANSRRIVVLLAAIVIVASACGSSPPDASATVDESADAEETTTSSAPVPTTEVATTSTTAPEPTINSREIITVIEDPTPGPLNLTAAGGISLDLPEDVLVWHTQNCVLLIRDGTDRTEHLPPLVAIGTSKFLGTTALTPISSADEWFARYEPAGAIAPEPNGEMITLLDEELDGYRIDGAFILGERVPDEVALNCAVDEDNVSELQIPTAGFSDVFVAETERGILFANATGFTREQAQSARELLDEVLPTIERSLVDSPDDGPIDVTTDSEPTSFRELDAGPARFTAAGGFTVELPQSFQTTESQHCLVLFDATYTGRSPFPPVVAFGISNFLGRNQLTPFSTPQEWFAAYEVAGEPVPAPTNETIPLLGEELDGFRSVAFPNGDTTDLATISCAIDSETLSDLQLFTAPHADVFTAETDDGVLVAIAHAFTEEEQLVARELFDAMVPTIEALSPTELTGNEADSESEEE